MAAVLTAVDADGDGTHVLPAVLAEACVQVLPVAGAGISWTDALRLPLGASDPTAVLAERLQTTLGEGPCLTASSTSTPLRATGVMMALRWPVFHHELLQQTPYRTIISLPLQSPQQERFGALDLYSTDDDAFSDLIVDQLSTEVADPIAAILFDQPPTSHQHPDDPPAWLDSQPVRDRMTVWVAIGMLMEHRALTNTEALSMLRGHAYTHDTTLDELATQITTRHITPDTVLNP
jgi:hypothetical protein